jgi:hypothetical protein
MRELNLELEETNIRNFEIHIKMRWIFGRGLEIFKLSRIIGECMMDRIHMGSRGICVRFRCLY